MILSEIPLTDLIEQVRKVVKEEILASGIISGEDKQNNQKPITTKELCTYLGISHVTIARWRKQNRIPFLRVGMNIRYKLNDVIKALENESKKS